MEEITVSIDTYIMNLKVTRKTSQQYLLEQQPQKHLRMRGNSRIRSPFAIAEIAAAATGGAFLVLRDSGSTEIIPKTSQKQSVLLDIGERELCFSHDQGKKATYTNIAVVANKEEDPVHLYVWKK